MAKPPNTRLLLVLPIQAYSLNGRVFIDDQACNGLRLWLENFDAITLTCVVHNAPPPPGRSPIDQIIGVDRLEFVGLPPAYTPYRFLVALPSINSTLVRLIKKCGYLHFAIGGLWGDWASIACLAASRADRPFAVWTDRVESKVVAFQAQSKGGMRRAYTKFTALLMSYYERWIIGKSAIGLFHGMDCYSTYAPFSTNPHLVHNIHLEKEDQLEEQEMEARLRRTGPLLIAYAGRVHREKGVFDWIEVMRLAKSAGVKFSATWFGDGPELIAAREAVAKLGLSDCVHFPGQQSEHPALMRVLKTFDAFVFCHKTPESPRCLIEALICGLPLIGYDSDYQRDLIHVHGGGLLTEIHKPALVAESVATFLNSKGALSRAALKDGRAFTARKIFRHRSELTRLVY